jgi:hypothetical protein
LYRNVKINRVKPVATHAPSIVASIGCLAP